VTEFDQPCLGIPTIATTCSDRSRPVWRGCWRRRWMMVWWCQSP